MPSSSLGGQISEDHVFKALQVRTSLQLLSVRWDFWSSMLSFYVSSFAFQLDSKFPEDPAIVEPCVTVLQKLNCEFYSGLSTEAQVILINF